MGFALKQPKSLIGRIFLWGTATVFLLLLIGFFWLRAWLGSYLESEDFRLWLGHITSKQIDARCEYAPFHFSGFTVNAEAFKAEGTEKAAFSTLEVDKIQTGINLHGLLNKALEVDNVNIDRLQISLGHTGAPPVPASEIGIEPTLQKSPAPPKNTWLSPKLDLRKVVIQDANVLWGEKTPQGGSMTKTKVTVNPNGDAWNILLEGGTVSQHGEPDFNLDHFKLQYQAPIVDINEGVLKFPQGGDIGITGEVNTEKKIDVHIKMNGVTVAPFLPPDVQSKLRGALFADISVSGPMPLENSLKVSGDAHLDNATVGGIPVLDFIAKIIRSDRFNRFNLDTASADFVYAGNTVTVTHLVVESKGLVCVTGHFVIKNSDIDGHFQIGIPHNFLGVLSVLESVIFTKDEGGYRWASMNLSGPLSSPHNDLLTRIEKAAPEAVLGVAEGLIKQAPKVPDVPKKALEGLFNQLHK